MGFFEKIKTKIVKKKQAKRRQMADRKRTIIERCVFYLEGKCSAVMKEVTLLEKKARTLEWEARNLYIDASEDAFKDAINHRRNEYERVSYSCGMKRRECEGSRSVLYALYDLDSLVKVLYTKEWYSYFVELPDTELAEDIKIENGEFAEVAKKINEKYEMLLGLMANQMADISEYIALRNMIQQAADNRKRTFEEKNDNDSSPDE